MRIPVQIGGPGRGPGRFIAPLLFIVVGAAVPIALYMQGTPLFGWQRFVPGAVGALFVLVGIGSLIGQMRASAARERDQQELEKYREAPWRVRPEWRRNEIEAGSTLERSFVFFALFWNVFTWPLAVLLISSEQGAGDRAVWLVALFPLVGLGMLAKVAVELLRVRKYGRPVLSLDPMPLRLGRPFVGTLRAGVTRDNRPPDGFKVMVSCYRQSVRYTRSNDGGRSKKVERRLLWRDETRVRDDPLMDGTAVEIPVRFTLPTDTPASTPLKTESRILWEVAAQAETPGVDFSASVEVPVFPADGDAIDSGSSPPSDAQLHAAGTSAHTGDDAGGHVESDALRRFEKPVTAGIELIDEPDIFELHFTAARKRKSALVLGLVGGVMLLAGFPLLGASILIGLIFIAMGGLLVFGSIQQGTNDTIVAVADGHVEVTHDGVGMPADVRLPAAQVADVQVSLSSSGSDSANYSISLVAANGDGLEHLKEQSERAMGWISKVGVDESHPAMEAMREGLERPTILVAGDLTDKDEADWLAERIRQALTRSSEAS